MPSLAEFARTPAVCGSEELFLLEVAALLPRGWRAEWDSFGSLIARRGAAEGAAEGVTDGVTEAVASSAQVGRLIVVGIDEPGYVVSQIRDDGWLRLRTVGRSVPASFHLAREGRPVSVLTRGRLGGVPGVIVVNSVHLRAPRPEVLGEEHLYLDVGADSADGVASLGIELLDAVAMREVVTLADGRTAGPALGSRAAAWALLSALADLQPAGEGAAEGAGETACAFVAQSLPGTGPLGRGGDGAVRQLDPQEVVLLRVSGAADQPAATAASLEGGPAGWSVLQLRVGHAGSAVETVAAGDIAAFRASLAALLTQPAPAPTAPPAGSPQ